MAGESVPSSEPLEIAQKVKRHAEAHWDAYVRALDYRVTAEDEAFIDGLVAPGHASTPGFNDPGHLVEGRIARGAHAPVR